MADILRLDQRVPRVYVEESRDMQTLLRLLTIAVSNAKYNIDSITYANNAYLINNRLLKLLQTKVGFYTKKEFTDDEIRYTVNVFSYLVRNKGSFRALNEAVRLFFQINNITGKSKIDINNEQHTIDVYLMIQPRNIDLLVEIFRYIMPPGYIVGVHFYNEQENDINLTERHDNYIYVLGEDEDFGTNIFRYPTPTDIPIADIEWTATVNATIGYESLDTQARRIKMLGYETDMPVGKIDGTQVTITLGPKNFHGAPSTMDVTYQNLDEDIITEEVTCNWNFVGTHIFDEDIRETLGYDDFLITLVGSGKVVRDYDYYLDAATNKFILEIRTKERASINITKKNVIRSVDTQDLIYSPNVKDTVEEDVEENE